MHSAGRSGDLRRRCICHAGVCGGHTDAIMYVPCRHPCRPCTCRLVHAMQALVETAMLAAVSGLAYLIATILKIENSVRPHAEWPA
eukprot:365338-Chlamydomonas_euryale.AAC.27